MTGGRPPFRIEKLRQGHLLAGFDCGREALDRFLVRHALQSQRAGSSSTYLTMADEVVIGFHTLVVGQAEPEEAPERLSKGLGRHPVPLMILARLAVSKAWQGRGFGAGLLKDAMLRTLGAADIAGIRALAVHAKDEQARSFYEHFDFVPSPTDPFHLFVLLKDVRAHLGPFQSPL
ncbi:MAG: GNAT family N-acetyltransferase [Polyangia bacterium]|jgi:GNAT superfamily N-acetyltransferase|nr:GNAT family N-acetyltransferase [Polyangia bacterium]